MEGIIHEIRILASQFELVVFKFSPRSCNKAANFVAACVVKENDVIRWDDFEPSWLFDILVTDVHVFIRSGILQEEGRNNDLGRGGQHGCDRGLGEGMEETENGAGFSGMKIRRRHSYHRITVWWLRFFFSFYYLFI